LAAVVVVARLKFRTLAALVAEQMVVVALTLASALRARVITAALVARVLVVNKAPAAAAARVQQAAIGLAAYPAQVAPELLVV
jgi:hypothetical protein